MGGIEMKDLIEALIILSFYGDFYNPTHCEHDTLFIVGINPTDVSLEDKEKLDQLGFFISEDDECFMSYRFGSA
jgi:hypothetical protein